MEHGSFFSGSEFACTMYISYFFAMQATSSFRLCEKREVYVILYSWSEQSLTKDKFHLFLVAYILFQYGGILALHNLLSVFMNYCLVIKLVCWSTILNKRIPLSYLYYEIGWKFWPYILDNAQVGFYMCKLYVCVFTTVMWDWITHV